MKDQETQTPKAGRKPYRKPEIRQVLLRPEEAVLGACKTASSTGPTRFPCNWTVPCTTAGS
jgi:hypothetical protein